jgi:transcriptional regulator
MVLKTLDAAGQMHGYGIAQHIQLISQDALSLNQGTLYPALLRLDPALLRLEQRGWIQSEWGKSQNNRRARFYSLTIEGRRQLATETKNWERMASIMQRLLDSPGQA